MTAWNQNMQIGIISDTHGDLNTTQKAVRMFESLEVDEVIHCGDLCDPPVVSLFSAWPTHFVFGNMDDQVMLRGAIETSGQTCHERFGQVQREGRRIAFLHGDDGRLLRETIRRGSWDLVCHGHTHVAVQYVEESTLVINPGAIWRTGLPSVAVVDLPSLKASEILL